MAESQKASDSLQLVVNIVSIISFNEIWIYVCQTEARISRSDHLDNPIVIVCRHFRCHRTCWSLGGRKCGINSVEAGGEPERAGPACECTPYALHMSKVERATFHLIMHT